MKCIAAVDLEWAIGRDNELLFHIPQDLACFKEKTVGKVVVMGKNTLLSLPGQKPLADRTNIVLSTTVKGRDYITCNSLSALFDVVKKFDKDDVFVMGGEQVYNLLLPYCSAAYITKVYKKGNGTKFFPCLDNMQDWKLTYKGSMQKYGELEFRFCEYERLFEE